jgi:hypothetical protein
MSRATSPQKKNAFGLDPIKIRKAKRVLGTTTEAETIERALDEIVDEDRRNTLALKAHERFLKSGAQIDDVYGNLKQ